MPPHTPCEIPLPGHPLDLTLDNATLLMSNLGGVGGRDGELQLDHRPIILIGNVGTLPSGERIDLEVSS
jgi:hypothetical protein